MVKPFQFSIRSMLAAMAVIGLSLGAIAGKPSAVSGTLLLLMLSTSPAVIVIGIASGGRYLRAFCIGAFVPSAAGLVFVGKYVFGFYWHAHLGELSDRWISFLEDPSIGPHYRGPAAMVWCFALAGGLCCMAFRWLLGNKTVD
jgi:hypothetical protein